MPNFSINSGLMPSSPIRKLASYAQKAREKGLQVYQLNIGQPDVASPDFAVQQLKETDLSLIAYSPSEGYYSLRETVAKYYNEFSQGIQGENIMVTTGGSEALQMCFSVTCNPGDEVIVIEPFYANYLGFCRALGIELVGVNSCIEDGFALPNTTAIEQKISKKTKAILLCNPGNPTGYVYSKQEMEAVADLAIKHDLFVIVDEVYREFCYDNIPHVCALNLEAIADRVIVIDSVSKRFSLCGARVGFLVSRNLTFMELALKYAQARLSPPSLGQIIAEASFKQHHAYIAQSIKKYESRRSVLTHELKKIPGLQFTVPKGAFYVVVELPVDNAEDFCKWVLSDFQYENKTLMMAPASGFYTHAENGIKQVRIAYVLEEKELIQAVLILNKSLKAYQQLKSK